MNATAMSGFAFYTAGFDLDLVREHLNTFKEALASLQKKIVNDYSHYR